jgi:hypothetical protein
MSIFQIIKSILRPNPAKPFDEVANWKRLMNAARGGIVYNFCQQEHEKAKANGRR